MPVIKATLEWPFIPFSVCDRFEFIILLNFIKSKEKISQFYVLSTVSLQTKWSIEFLNQLSDYMKFRWQLYLLFAMKIDHIFIISNTDLIITFYFLWINLEASVIDWDWQKFSSDTVVKSINLLHENIECCTRA